MTFGWYNERELCNGHSSYVCHPVYRAVKFETYLICIVFCDPTPVFSNFHIVPGPSLEYNAAIFTECFPRIKKNGIILPRVVCSACDLLADP